MKRRQVKKRSASKQFWLIFIVSFISLIMLCELVLVIINSIINRGQYLEYSVPLYIMPFVALAFTFLLIFLIRKHNRKSRLIIDSMQKIAEGDYSVRIQPVKRDKEFNKIYENFNKMAEELSSVKTLREDFIHDFSHEFKTPISAIEGFATLLLEGGLSEEEQKKFLQIIADESVRLWHLADNTLTLSKLENQQLVGETEDIRLDIQIKESIIMSERDWERKNIELSSDLIPVTFRGNSALLMQVWLNLISNAIKFTPEGGKISVSLREEQGEIRVTVTDNGIGVAPAERERIFDKRYRSSDAKDTEGNGLGLAICKRICELSGGSIFVTDAPTSGSAFTVVLPSY